MWDQPWGVIIVLFMCAFLLAFGEKISGWNRERNNRNL